MIVLDWWERSLILSFAFSFSYDKWRWVWQYRPKHLLDSLILTLQPGYDRYRYLSTGHRRRRSAR